MMSTMQDKLNSSTTIMLTLCVGVIGAILANSSPALADDLPDRTQDYLKCSLIADLSPRLACYDAVSASLRQAVQAPAQVAPTGQAPTTDAPAQATPPAESSAEDRSSFGAQHLRRDQKPEEPDEIRVLVTSWRTSPLGKMVFTTEDGQVWRQSDSNRVFPRTEQFHATIKKGMMGSFFLKIDGIRRNIRVKRIR